MIFKNSEKAKIAWSWQGMLTVPARELQEWANTYQAESELPRWIARLIAASCDTLTRLDMPGGELVNLAGFDGIVECLQGNEFVPEGTSAWELSVNAAVKSKADEDFGKRTGDPLHLQKNNVTFVFATPRKWGGGTNWEAQKRRADWKDVRVLWSAHLERWFEHAPWIAAAFLESIGKCPPGFQSFEMIWSGYERVPGAPLLTPDFVMGGRIGAATKFVSWLFARNASLTIRVSGESKREVLHYLAASVRREKLSDTASWEARIFAVHSEEAARGLGRLNRSHVVLAPSGPVLEWVLRAQDRSGCRIVILDTTPAEEPVQPAPGIESVHLGSVPETIWIQSLVRTGFTPEQAISLCRSSGCSYEGLRKAAFLY